MSALDAAGWSLGWDFDVQCGAASRICYSDPAAWEQGV